MGLKGWVLRFATVGWWGWEWRFVGVSTGERVGDCDGRGGEGAEGGGGTCAQVVIVSALG